MYDARLYICWVVFELIFAFISLLDLQVVHTNDSDVLSHCLMQLHRPHLRFTSYYFVDREESL
jgi:hypothetical protein